jgi:hypothetical protein
LQGYKATAREKQENIQQSSLINRCNEVVAHAHFAAGTPHKHAEKRGGTALIYINDRRSRKKGLRA